MRPLVLLVAGALLGACGAQRAAESQDLEIDCVALAQSYPLAGVYNVTSIYDGRCQGVVSDTIYGTDVPFQGDGIGQPNTATMILNFAGRAWVVKEGAIRLSVLEDGLKVGRYEGRAVDSANGDTAGVKGRIDWCDYVNRSDCPHAPGLDGLDKRVTFLDPQNVGTDEGTFATDCRVLFDRSVGAVLVELELGIFRGVNVGIYQKYCDKAYGPSVSRFTFRAPGVTAPGTHGPTVGVAFPGAFEADTVYLPGFRFTLPYAYDVLGQGTFNACDTNYGRVATTASGPETACTWTISESPGHFSLSCTDAVRYEGGGSGGLPVKGAFNLEADCDVRWRD